MRALLPVVLLLATAMLACGDDTGNAPTPIGSDMSPGADADTSDANHTDASTDAGSDDPDAGMPDAGVAELRADFVWQGTTEVGEVLRFDASTTTAPDGAQLDYFWRIGEATKRGVQTSQIFDAPGDYVVELVVKDTSTSDRSSRHLDFVTIEGEPDPLSLLELRIRATARDDTPLPNVEIAVESHRAFTDAGGLASLEVAAPNPALLNARLDGYAPRSTSLEYREGIPVEWRVRMDPLEIQTADVSDGAVAATAAGVILEASQGTFVDSTGAPASTEANFELLAPPVCENPDSVPAAPALANDGTRPDLTRLGAAYVDWSDELHLAGVTNFIDVRIPICGNANAGDVVSIWYLEGQRWIEKETTTLVDDSGAVFAPARVDKGGWWLAARATTFDATVRVSCQYAGQPQNCLVNLSGPGGFADEAQVDGSATIDTVTGEICASTETEAGRCRADICGDASTNQTTDIVLDLDCFGDGFPLIFDGEPRTGSVTTQNPSQGWQFRADAGEGVILRVNPAISLDGTLELRDQTGSLHASEPIDNDPDGLAYEIPFDGIWYAQVIGSSVLPSGFEIQLDIVPVLRPDSTYRGNVTEERSAIDHIVWLEPDQLVLNAFFNGAVENARVEFQDLEGNRYTSTYRTVNNVAGTNEFPDSGIVGLPEPGWWVVRLVGAPTASAGSYRIALSSIREFDVNLVDGVFSRRGELSVVGEHHLYRLDANAGDGVQIRVYRDGPTPAGFAGVRVFRLGTGTAAEPEERVLDFLTPFARLFDDTLESKSLQIPADGTYLLDFSNYAAFDGISESGGYEIRVDLVAGSSAITVDDDGQCAGAVESLEAAMRAVETQGTLTLCAGDYRIDHPLEFESAGVTLAGDSMDTTTVTWMRPRVYGPTNRATINVRAANTTIRDLTIAREEVRNEPHEGNYLWLFDDATTLDGVRIQAQPATNTLAIRDSGGISLTILNSEILDSRLGLSGNFTDLTLQNNTFSVADTAVSSAVTTAIVTDNTITSGGGITLRHSAVGAATITIERNDVTVTGSSIVGIGVSGVGPPDATSRSATIRDNIVTTTGQFAPAIQLSPPNPTTLYTVERNLLNTALSDVVLIQNPTTTPIPWGVVTLKNNVMTGFDRYSAVEIFEPARYTAVDILHNTMQAAQSATDDELALELRILTASTGALPISFSNNVYDGDGGDAIDVSGPGTGYQVTTSGNLFWEVGAKTGPDVSGTGIDLMSMDPNFIDAELRVSPTSAAVDAVSCASGVSVDFSANPRPQGSGCDAGAHEQ